MIYELLNTLLQTAPLRPGNEVPEGTFFQKPEGVAVIIVLSVTFTIVVLVIAYMMRKSYKENWQWRGVPVGAVETFRLLCDANQLTSTEVYLMKRVVSDLGLKNPLLPFAKPEILESYLPIAPENRRHALRVIQAKLFA